MSAGRLASGWSRIGLGWAALHVVLQPPAGRVSKERAEGCQGLLAYAWGGHVVTSTSYPSGHSQSHGQSGI